MNQQQNEFLEEEQPTPNYTFFWWAFGSCIASFLFLGLAFSPLGLYSLLGAMILSLASLSFCNRQKKKYDFEKLKYMRIAAYIPFVIGIVFFIAGAIYVGINQA